jgi:hypothetical protein
MAHGPRHVSSYGIGSFLDTGLVASYLLIGLGASRAVYMPSTEAAEPRVTIVAPYVPVLAVLVVTAVETILGHRLESVASIMVLSLALLVFGVSFSFYGTGLRSNADSVTMHPTTASQREKKPMPFSRGAERSGSDGLFKTAGRDPAGTRASRRQIGVPSRYAPSPTRPSEYRAGSSRSSCWPPLRSPFSIFSSYSPPGITDGIDSSTPGRMPSRGWGTWPRRTASSGRKDQQLEIFRTRGST